MIDSFIYNSMKEFDKPLTPMIKKDINFHLLSQLH